MSTDRDAMTLASGVVAFAEALSDRLVDVTEDTPVDTVDTREGFRLTRIFPIGKATEPEGFGLVLDDERTDQEFVVSWTPADGWHATDGSFVELDESSTVGASMEAILARMRRRRENSSATS